MSIISTVEYNSVFSIFIFNFSYCAINCYFHSCLYVGRYRGYGSRDRKTEYKEKSVEASHIDKKKLLEIARKNAIQMMKSGSLSGALSLGPQAQEKVIAAIKCGGKTVEELTDFCKTLSKKEEMGELSSLSEENSSDNDSEKPFHHPFQIKEKPVSITMNIKVSYHIFFMHSLHVLISFIEFESFANQKYAGTHFRIENSIPREQRPTP